MSRAKGTANLAASLEVLAGAPLDAREKVPTKADLYLAANFPYPYVGLETYVVSENKKYRLIGNDVTVESNWQEVGSGGGGGTTVVANPEGEATEELEKLQDGNDIYSIPEENVEINKDQFDALPAATKNNGKAYFIPDANLVSNFTVMGNRFDKANIYDTTERMVGRWIDGKPLYQKSFSGKTPSSDTIIYTGAEGDNIVNISGFVDSADINYYDTGNWYVRTWRGTANTVYMRAAGFTNKDYTITIQYTKTTDTSIEIGTENDYSTDEMIIGTWIDGKPVYQKSFDITETTIHGANAFEITLLSNVDFMISQNFMFMDEGLPNGKPIPKACWVAQDGYTHEASGYWYASYFYINPTTHDLKMRRDGNSGILHLCGTIQYTKTTD